MELRVSGVGVLDKSMVVLGAVAGADSALSLGELVSATGLSRATAHRLAVALEVHGMLRRDGDGRFAPGFRLIALGQAASAGWPLADAARPVLEWLVATTGESAQLYVRDGDQRVCLESLESPHELRTIVEVGARLALDVGSAGRVLAPERGRRPTASAAWVESVEERAPGVASVSAPVRGNDGAVVAAVSVSGPVERTTRHPGRRYGEAVAEAARRVESAVALGLRVG